MTNDVFNSQSNSQSLQLTDLYPQAPGTAADPLQAKQFLSRSMMDQEHQAGAVVGGGDFEQTRGCIFVFRCILVVVM